MTSSPILALELEAGEHDGLSRAILEALAAHRMRAIVQSVEQSPGEALLTVRLIPVREGKS